MREISLNSGFDPQTVQPAVGGYTHYSSPVHINVLLLLLLLLLLKFSHCDSLVNGNVFYKYCCASCSASLVWAGLLNVIL